MPESIFARKPDGSLGSLELDQENNLQVARPRPNIRDYTTTSTGVLIAAGVAFNLRGLIVSNATSTPSITLEDAQEVPLIPEFVPAVGSMPFFDVYCPNGLRVVLEGAVTVTVIAELA